MSVLRVHAVGFARSAWTWLRQVTGDAAYDNYLRSMERAAACDSIAPKHAGNQPLSRADFYLDVLRRRYSSVSRCC
jgi:uncharacterized short protein YbdD (DUF466 family)